MAIKWTDKQKAAIEAPSDRDILLVAGAGSGKTAVLTERVVRRLIQADLRPDQMLVVTFTKKAAAQMLEKIEQKLEEAQAKSSDPALAQRLEDLRDSLPLAQISTIDAFCWQLVQAYRSRLTFKGQLRLSDRTRALDESEQAQVLMTAIEEVLAEAYQALTRAQLATDLDSEDLAETRAWAQDLDRLFSSLDQASTDRELKAQISQDYSFLRSLPNYLQALDRAALDGADDLSKLAGSKWLADFLDQLEEVLSNFRRGLVELDLDPYMDQWRTKRSKAKEFLQLSQLLARSRDLESQWQELGQALADYEAGRDEVEFDLEAGIRRVWDRAQALGQIYREEGLVPAVRKAGDELSEKNRLRELYGQLIAPMLNLLTGQLTGTALARDFGLEAYPAYFSYSFDQLLDLHREAYQRSLTYLDLIKSVDLAYTQLKLDRQVVDFADFAHLAAELLADPEIARDLAQKYLEIYIDEYQDTSPLQESILEALSGLGHEGQENCRFMVGDVKQSIYRFRHAEPSLFQDRARAYTVQPDRGRLLNLTENFRSEARILDFVNLVFSNFMRRETAEIDYDQSQRLISGLAGVEGAGPEAKTAGKVKLRILLDQAGDSQAEIGEADWSGQGQAPGVAGLQTATQEIHKLLAYRDKVVDEALLAADEILALCRTKYRYGDITVLCRTNSDLATYDQVLRACQIPISTVRKVLIDSQQLILLTNFIELLVNPLQDLPLLAYLRSYIHGPAIQEADLASLAAEGGRLCPEPSALDQIWSGPYFYQKLAAYLDQGPEGDLKDRVKQAMDQLANWRDRLTYLPYPQVLAEVLQADGYTEYLAHFDQDGLDRLADLDLFMEWVEAAWEKGQSLSEFSRDLVRLREGKEEIRDQDRQESAVGKVRLLTIHAAKGLESKVVILARNQRQLVRKQAQPPFLFSTAQAGAAGDTTDHRLQVRALAWDQASDRRIILPAYAQAQAAESRRDLAEEYRLLYVALTRAQEELCILGQVQDYQQLAAMLNRLARPPLVQTQVRQEGAEEGLLQLESEFVQGLATSLDLILACLAADLAKQAGQRDSSREEGSNRGPESFYQLGAEGLAQLGSSYFELNPYTQIQLISKAEMADGLIGIMSGQENKLGKKAVKVANYSLQDLAISLDLASLQGRKIPYSELFSLPNKLTVTELSKQGQDLALADSNPAEAGDQGPASRQLPGLREMALQIEPLTSSLAERADLSLSPAAYGSFIHRLFQYLTKLPESTDREELDTFLRAEIASWIEHGLLSQREGSLALEPETLGYLRAFLQSDLAGELRQALSVQREMPFTLALPAANFYQGQPGQAQPDLGDEISLVQGMIDLYFVKPDKGVVLVDYKSDRIAGDPATKQAVLRKRYRDQLGYYKEAIQRITKSRVDRSLIWLIRDGIAIEVD